MARNEYEESIDGFAFRHKHLGARDAIRLEARLLKALGSNAASFQKLVGSGGADVGAMVGILASVDESELLSIVELVASGCSVRPDGGDTFLVMTPQVVDVQFAGRPLLLWRWLGAAIKFQLADFFGVRPSA